MANQTVASMTAASAFDGTELLYVVQGGANTKGTWAQALTYVLAGSGTLTNKTYDTAGTGNTFKINGTTVNALTGTGSTLVASAGPTLTGVLTLTGGTVNGTVLDISQTWGSTGTYTGINYNVTNSGPANSDSLLLSVS